MADPIKDRIASITDEVAELHPLLHELLVKLPNVKRVEYTHGPTEMGADFVYSREHAALGRLEYVGVIAKIGKLHQNFDDVERQISECEVPRLFASGKEKIRITEVWVVVTQNVTAGAQRKIREKFKGRKVEFVSGTDLLHMVKEHLPGYLSGLDPGVAETLELLRDAAVKADRSFSLLGVQDTSFYVEQDVYKIERGKYTPRRGRKSRPAKVDVFSTIESNSVVLLEGGMGSGKSRLVRHITTEYTAAETFKAKRIVPVPLTFKEFVQDFDSDIDGVIEAKTSKMGDVGPEVQFLILIDGLDEVQLDGAAQLDAISAIAATAGARPNARVLVTTRWMRGLDEIGEAGRAIVRLELRPLSPTKTLQFVRELCKTFDFSDRIAEDLKRSQLFKELPRNPISAILLARILNEDQQDLPSSMTELYAKFTELVLGRWDMQKGLQSQREYEALLAFLGETATYMLDNELVVLATQEAQQRLSDYLGMRQLGLDSTKLFAKLCARCELVVVDNTAGTFQFRHRTFAEFLCARQMHGTSSLEIDERAFLPYWRNVYYFYVGSKKDAAEEIDALVAVEPASDIGQWSKILSLGNFLLAGYTTPYRHIITAMKSVAIELAVLYKDISSGASPSPFAVFPQMGLLYVFKFVMQETYGYKFLAGAITDAIQEIERDAADTDLKVYATFFLCAAASDLGSEEEFDFLVTKYKDELPLDVMEAVRWEAAGFEVQSRAVKQHMKRLRKIKKGNSSLQAKLDKMYKKAISSEGGE